MDSIRQNIQPHLRIIIRKRVKELIKFHCDVNGKVFLSRPNNIFLNEVPCCLIYFVDDSAEKPNTNVPRKYDRNLELNIHFLNRWNNREELEIVDDWFDSRELETIYSMEIDFSESADWLGLDFIENCYLVRSKPLTLDGSGEVNVESNLIIYSVEYNECLNFLEPSVFNDFKKLYAKYFTVEIDPGSDPEEKKLLAEDHINIES